ncbi:hypothetical protein Dimus_032106 [Dionaea muscipula]
MQDSSPVRARTWEPVIYPTGISNLRPVKESCARPANIFNHHKQHGQHPAATHNNGVRAARPAAAVSGAASRASAWAMMEEHVRPVEPLGGQRARAAIGSPLRAVIHLHNSLIAWSKFGICSTVKAFYEMSPYPAISTVKGIALDLA